MFFCKIEKCKLERLEIRDFKIRKETIRKLKFGTKITMINSHKLSFVGVKLWNLIKGTYHHLPYKRFLTWPFPSRRRWACPGITNFICLSFGLHSNPNVGQLTMCKEMTQRLWFSILWAQFLIIKVFVNDESTLPPPPPYTLDPAPFCPSTEGI